MFAWCNIACNGKSVGDGGQKGIEDFNFDKQKPMLFRVTKLVKIVIRKAIGGEEYSEFSIHTFKPAFAKTMCLLHNSSKISKNNLKKH